METILTERVEIANLDRSIPYLSVTFDVDAESIWMVMAKGKDRPSLISQGVYGIHHGIPRALEMLSDLHIKSTFFIPGIVAQKHPSLAREIFAAGHEVASHCHTHMPLSALDDRAEWDDIKRSKEILEQQIGAAVLGFAAPVSDVSARTVDYLIRLGFGYDRSYLDADWPYLFKTGHGSLVELPISWVLDDFTFFGHNLMPAMGWGIQHPGHVGEIWRGELQSFAQGGGFGCLVLHPEVVGRRTRMATLREVLAEFSGQHRFWTCAEVAAHVRGASET